MTKKTLLLLRHGKSNWNFDIGDFDRPLKKRGKRASRKVGAWLKQQALFPDLIVSSPAERAKDTAKRSAAAMGLKADLLTYNRGIYLADVATLLEVIRSLSETTPIVMMVGHNPGFELLVEFLAKGDVPEFDDGKLMPTATLAQLSFDGPWAYLGQEAATLEQLIRPSMLGEDSPGFI